MEKEDASKPELKPSYRYSRVLSVALPAVYAAVLTAFCVTYRVFPGPEFLVLCFLIYAANNKWSHRFVRDWIPFVSIFVSYEALNGTVGSLPRIVHVTEPATAELRIFGAIPTLVLQQSFRSPFLDYMGAFFYSLHFIAPVVFAFVLWRYRPENFSGFTWAIALGTYSALVTFLLYPVAPPWVGVDATRILFQVDNNMGIPFYRTIFDFVQSNPYAAFPSLHAMYPWLISLFALKIKKTKALPVLIFPVGVWFSAVYLGEHYVVDVVGGIIYATCAFLVVEKLFPYFARIRGK